MWLLYALLSALFAALVSIFGKIGLGKIDPTFATAVRAVIMAGFFLLATAYVGKLNPEFFRTLDARSLSYIALSGLAGALSWLFFFNALAMASPVSVNAIDRLSIVFILIFGALFLGESLSLMRVLAVSLIALGAILIAVYKG